MKIDLQKFITELHAVELDHDNFALVISALFKSETKHYATDFDKSQGSEPVHIYSAPPLNYVSSLTLGDECTTDTSTDTKS